MLTYMKSNRWKDVFLVAIPRFFYMVFSACLVYSLYRLVCVDVYFGEVNRAERGSFLF